MKNSVIYILCILGLLVTGCSQDNGQLESLIKFKDCLIAHRGISDNNETYENTTEAIIKAINLGYRGAEIDVNETKDGKLILSHEYSILDAQINQTDYDDLMDLALQNNKIISNLEEVLDVVIFSQDNFLLFMELKRCDINHVHNEIQKRNLQDKIIIISFNKDYCEEAISLGYKTMYLDSDLSPKELYEKGYYGADYQFGIFKKNKSLITQCKEYNLATACWTPNDVNDINQLIYLGIDYITTDLIIVEEPN